MTIHLPTDLETSIEAVVHSCRFASVDDAMAEAARLLLREIRQERSEAKPTATDSSPDPLLGIWRDAPDEIDEIFADAMRHRREQPWRAIPGE
jgi:Arc/MetJ-type ribon-helix-helix transcriptional regulator